MSLPKRYVYHDCGSQDDPHGRDGGNASRQAHVSIFEKQCRGFCASPVLRVLVYFHATLCTMLPRRRYSDSFGVVVLTNPAADRRDRFYHRPVETPCDPRPVGTVFEIRWNGPNNQPQIDDELHFRVVRAYVRSDFNWGTVTAVRRIEHSCKIVGTRQPVGTRTRYERRELMERPIASLQAILG
jgi:hypothetical protein